MTLLGPVGRRRRGHVDTEARPCAHPTHKWKRRLLSEEPVSRHEIGRREEREKIEALTWIPCGTHRSNSTSTSPDHPPDHPPDCPDPPGPARTSQTNRGSSDVFFAGFNWYLGSPRRLALQKNTFFHMCSTKPMFAWCRRRFIS